MHCQKTKKGRKVNSKLLVHIPYHVTDKVFPWRNYSHYLQIIKTGNSIIDEARRKLVWKRTWGIIMALLWIQVASQRSMTGTAESLRDLGWHLPQSLEMWLGASHKLSELWDHLNRSDLLTPIHKQLAFTQNLREGGIFQVERMREQYVQRLKGRAVWSRNRMCLRACWWPK